MEDHPTSIDSEFIDYERYLIDRWFIDNMANVHEMCVSTMANPTSHPNSLVLTPFSPAMTVKNCAQRVGIHPASWRAIWPSLTYLW